ncbi:MAG: TonB-dependent receptor [Oceanipulchritudo sp.]
MVSSLHRRLEGGTRIAALACLAGVFTGALAAPAEVSREIVELDPFVIEEGPLARASEIVLVTELPDRVPGSPVERLAALPGISLNTRGAFSSEPMIRGLGFDRVATRLNGLPLPNGSPTRTHSPLNAFGSTGGRALAVSSFLPSLSLGPPASGGAIDIAENWTLDGNGDLVVQPFTSLGITCLPDRGGIRWDGSAASEIGRAGYRLSFFGSDIGNYKSGDGRVVPASHADRGVFVSIAGKAGAGWMHSLDGTCRKQLLSDNISLPLDSGDGETLAVTATHQAPSRVNGADGPRVRYGYSRSRARLSNLARENIPVPVITDTDTESGHLDGSMVSSFPASGTFAYGLDAGFERRAAVRKRGPVARDYIWPDIHSRRVGIFVENRMEPRPDWSLRTGLRWDFAESEAKGAGETAFGVPIRQLYQQFSPSGRAETENTDHGLSANVLLQVDPTEKTRLYAGIGSSLQSPPPTERYRAFLNALGGGFEVGNPALEPERKWELVAGSEYRFESLSIQVDACYFCIENFIWRQLVGSTGDILPQLPSQPVFGYRNVEAEFYGLELQGVWKINQRLRIPFTLEWIDAELRQSGPGFSKGDSLPELPPAELRVSPLLLWEAGSLSGNIQWELHWSESRRNPLPEVNPLYGSTGSHTLHHVTISVQSGKAWQLDISVRNLFDKAYAPYLAPPASELVHPGSGLEPGDRVPGPGREFLFILSLEI